MPQIIFYLFFIFIPQQFANAIFFIYETNIIPLTHLHITLIVVSVNETSLAYHLHYRNSKYSSLHLSFAMSIKINNTITN